MIPNNDTESVIKKLEWKLAEKDKEIAELKAWKESAMSVMAPMQEIGKALGVRLGESIHDKILPGIERLKDELNTCKLLWKADMNYDQVEAYEKELHRIIDKYGYSETVEVLKKFKTQTP